jgi:hypothetical protein
MVKKQKTDPFASLMVADRNVTPSKLSGAKRVLWDELVEKHVSGAFSGMTYATLLTWGQEHLGLTCSLSCFRGALINAGKASKR